MIIPLNTMITTSSDLIKINFATKISSLGPQLTEIFFIQTSYNFTLSSLDKKHDHIIFEAQIDIQTYESFYDKFQTFSLTFHFLNPKERDLHCSHDIMLQTKQTHTFTYYRFIQNHFNLRHSKPSRHSYFSVY